MCKMVKPVVCAFDFDGTLTTRDSLLVFIRYARGTWRMAFGFALFSPLLVLMKLHLLANWRVKQWLFSWFFRGMDAERFDKICKAFARDNQQLLRNDTLKQMDEYIAQGHRVVVVSASIDNWVAPFFASRNVEVVGTQIDVKADKLTGRFLTPNCYGAEKVRRLLALYPDKTAYTLIAYGDSRGDRELLALADEAHWV